MIRIKVSAQAYNEILGLLRVAGYLSDDHAGPLDLHGITIEERRVRSHVYRNNYAPMIGDE
jgi:hypothetical protein